MAQTVIPAARAAMALPEREIISAAQAAQAARAEPGEQVIPVDWLGIISTQQTQLLRATRPEALMVQAAAAAAAEPAAPVVCRAVLVSAEQAELAEQPAHPGFCILEDLSGTTMEQSNYILTQLEMLQAAAVMADRAVTAVPAAMVHLRVQAVPAAQLAQEALALLAVLRMAAALPGTIWELYTLTMQKVMLLWMDPPEEPEVPAELQAVAATAAQLARAESAELKAQQQPAVPGVLCMPAVLPGTILLPV
jgi:hypothetical protein